MKTALVSVLLLIGQVSMAVAQYTNSTANVPGTGQTGSLGPGQTATLMMPPLPSPPYAVTCDETYEWWVNNAANNQPVMLQLSQGTENSDAGSCPMVPYTGDSHGFGVGVAPYNKWQGGTDLTVQANGYGHDLAARRDTIIPGSCGATDMGPYTLQTGANGQMPVLTETITNPSGVTIQYTMLAKYTCMPMVPMIVEVPSPTPAPSPTMSPSPTATPSPTPTPVCDFTLTAPAAGAVISVAAPSVTIALVGKVPADSPNWMNYYVNGTWSASSGLVAGTTTLTNVLSGQSSIKASEYSSKGLVCSQSVTVTAQ